MSRNIFTLTHKTDIILILKSEYSLIHGILALGHSLLSSFNYTEVKQVRSHEDTIICRRFVDWWSCRRPGKAPGTIWTNMERQDLSEFPRSLYPTFAK